MKERVLYFAATVIACFVLLVVISVYSALSGGDRVGDHASMSAEIENQGHEREDTTAAFTRDLDSASQRTEPAGHTMAPVRSAAKEPARLMSKDELMEAAYQRRRQRAEEMGVLDEFEKAEAEKQAMRAERKARGEAARKANREKRLSNRNNSAEKRLMREQRRAEHDASVDSSQY